MDISRILANALDEASVPIWGFLGETSLRQACESLPDRIWSQYGLDRAMGAVVAALPYDNGPSEPPEWSRPWPGKLVRLGRFARANWYGELSARLKEASRIARSAMLESASQGDRREAGAFESATAWHYLANSRLPEKRLALAAGLGELGRQSLVLVREAGPACVLGLILLPFDPLFGTDAGNSGLSKDRGGEGGCGENCGSCRACVDACPTGALNIDGEFREEHCIQYWSTKPGDLPAKIEAAWGDLLYGCDLCLEACPRFRPDAVAKTDRGFLGPGLPASWFLSVSDAEMRLRLRGTALGLGWMPPEAFRRNAALVLRDNGGN